MDIPTTQLNDAVKIPNIGFGLWKNKDREECINSVKEAVKAGYHHFDSAQVYGNEQFLTVKMLS